MQVSEHRARKMGENSQGRLVGTNVALVLLVAMASGSAWADGADVDVPAIAGKSVAEVGKLLGQPRRRGKFKYRDKSGQPAGKINVKYGDQRNYAKNAMEIVFIGGKADWITVHLPGVAFNASVLKRLNLPARSPTFSSSAVIRWTNIPGLLEVSAFPMGNGEVDYVYIKVKT